MPPMLPYPDDDASSGGQILQPIAPVGSQIRSLLPAPPMPDLPAPQMPAVRMSSLYDRLPQDAAAPALSPALVSQPVPQPMAPVMPHVLDAPNGNQERSTEGDIQQRTQPWNYGQHGFLRNVGHVLAGIGNVAGDIVAPSTMALIPGTQLHNQFQVAGERQRLAALKQNDLEVEDRNAQAQRLAREEDFRDRELQVQQQRLKEEEQRSEDADQTRLAAQGYKRDEQGNIVSLPPEELSAYRQSLIAFKGAQTEYMQAQQALRDAQRRNIPQQTALARQRLGIAEKAMRAQSEKTDLIMRNNGLDPEAFDQAQGLPQTHGAHQPGEIQRPGLGRVQADQYDRYGYYEGQQLPLRDGRTITVRKIHNDGSFDE